jgi:hypothetical protein
MGQVIPSVGNRLHQFYWPLPVLHVYTAPLFAHMQARVQSRRAAITQRMSWYRTLGPVAAQRRMSQRVSERLREASDGVRRAGKQGGVLWAVQCLVEEVLIAVRESERETKKAHC